MNYNEKFNDLFEDITSKAKSLGFRSARQWAKFAVKEHEIDLLDQINLNHLRDLRNHIAHGASRDIRISKETYKLELDIYKLILNSKIRYLANRKPTSKPNFDKNIKTNNYNNYSNIDKDFFKPIAQSKYNRYR